MIYTPQTLMRHIQFLIEVEDEMPEGAKILRTGETFCSYCTGTPCKCEDINSKIDEL